MQEESVGEEIRRVHRRRYDAEFKRDLVAKTLVRGASVSRLAREHGINANQLFKWRRQHLLAEQSRKERAVEIYALASREAYVANSHWFYDVAGRSIASLAAALPPGSAAAAQAKRRPRAREPAVMELLADFESQPETLGT